MAGILTYWYCEEAIVNHKLDMFATASLHDLQE